MAKKSYSLWMQPKCLQYGALLITLFTCTTSFAFTRICMKMIPGVWFAATMRLEVLIWGVKTYTLWSQNITVGYQACFSTNIYGPLAAGSTIIPQVLARSGAIVNCVPTQTIASNPSPGTYTYNVWGTLGKPFCK